MVEQRVVETTDGIAVAMQGAAEALVGIVGNRRPGATAMVDVGVHKDLQVLAVLYIVIQWLVTRQLCAVTQVEEVGKQVETVDTIGAIVIDVDLRLALHVVAVNIVMVVRGIHHLLQVVVVGHAELHGVRVSLADITLGIVGHIVAVLIPVHRCLVVAVGHTIAMELGIGGVVVDFPATTNQLIGTRCHLGLVHAHGSSRQYGRWRQQLVDDWCTTLKLQVDVDDVELVHQTDTLARFVTLVIGVLIDDGDNLLLRQVVDIAFTTHIERGLLCGLITLDKEAALLVNQVTIVVGIDDPAFLYRGARAVLCGIQYLTFFLSVDDGG